MNKSIKSVIAAVAAFAISGSLSANSEFVISEKDIASVPELSESLQSMATTNSASPSMRCMVDTPAWDYWGSPICFSAGWANNATAYFQIQNAPSNFTVYWSDSRCSSTSTSCALPIRAYRSITLSADVLDHSNGTFSSTSATANYEGMH